MGAMSLTALGESDKAREWNRRALEMNPDDPSVLYHIGCAFAMEGQSAEAIDALCKPIDQRLRSLEVDRTRCGSEFSQK